MNLLTIEDLACRVARALQTREGHELAGGEFLEPSERFWGEHFSAGSAEQTRN
jgi:hypothetical protein